MPNRTPSDLCFKEAQAATLPLPSSPPVCPNDVTSALYMR